VKANLKLTFSVTSLRWRKLFLVILLGHICSTLLAVEFVDLGTLGGSSSWATDVNESDKVIMISSLPGDTDAHIALYSHGHLRDISEEYNLVTTDYVAWANAINNRGEIAINDPIGRAAVLNHGQVLGLGIGTYSTILAINNPGKLVGYWNINGLPRAFSYYRGELVLLGPSSTKSISSATAINNSGVIVGLSSVSFAVPVQGWIYQNGVTTYLAPFGYVESTASDVNNWGDVVGSYYDGTMFHAFLYQGGTFTSIGDRTNAFAINDFDQIVGEMTFNIPPNQSVTHAFLYENGTITDLNSLIDPSLGWELVEAFAINNRGSIVGVGYLDGHVRAYLIRR
jgi:probable HAF family extracellular repeat protein